MPYKPEMPVVPTLLSGFSVLSAAGPDAAAFLQAQTMNDVASLAPFRWQWNGWLTPKGRVVALFALARLDDARFVLVSPDVPAAELQAALQRFVFRRKVVLSADAGLQVAAGPPCPAAAGAVVAEVGGGFALDFGGDGGPRTLWLLPADAGVAPPDAAVDAAWRSADLAHGLPRLGPGQREAWTPQMLSLERLAAFSVKKGCYPGQEIVARTHFLGQAKRRLVRVRGEGLAEGDTVTAASQPAGTIVCTDTAGREALAVVSAGVDEALAVAGRDLAALTLNAGMQRVT